MRKPARKNLLAGFLFKWVYYSENELKTRKTQLKKLNFTL